MQKVSITSDAMLWAELAKCRHENFCSPFLRVASVESTRIYEKLVAKKVKYTPLMSVSVVLSQTPAKTEYQVVISASSQMLRSSCPALLYLHTAVEDDVDVARRIVTH